MLNPFKKIRENAESTKKKWEHREVSELTSKKCINCGATRPKDTNLITCDYCGFKFMDIDTEIKADN